MDSQARQVCAVVGAGPGMGMAIARRFGREGMAVGLIARRPATLEAGVASLSGNGIAARGFPADAEEWSSLEGALDAVATTLGAPTVLVYNAAVVDRGYPSQVRPEDLAGTLDVNVVAALVATRAVLPAMRAGGRGTLLYTGGGLSLRPAPVFATLAVGKAALRALALTLAQELEPEGIHAATVTIAGLVQPGTPFDPDTIAEEYWRLHTQPRGAWEAEVVYRGQG